METKRLVVERVEWEEKRYYSNLKELSKESSLKELSVVGLEDLGWAK